MKKLVITSLIVTGALSWNVFAAQDENEKSTIAAYEALAMSETDMGGVSAVSGQNVLNIHGASAGGLMQENEESSEPSPETLNEWGFSEGKSTQVFADEALKKVQDDLITSTETIAPQTNNDSLSVITDSSVVGEAQVFATSSEISYKKSNFSHNTEFHDNNSISVSRDLHIDMLKLENLSGDSLDHHRSVGSIYMSNWSSQGDTTLTPR
jgi:hypothetical protein